MSPKLAVLKPRELIAILKSHGYQEVGQSGSHLKSCLSIRGAIFRMTAKTAEPAEHAKSA